MYQVPVAPPPVPNDDAGLDDLLREVKVDSAAEECVPAMPGCPSTPSASAIAVRPAPDPIQARIDRMRGAGFEFPAGMALRALFQSNQSLPESDLLARLRVLQHHVVGYSPDPRDYVECREETCALNLILNERKTLAPLLRPYRRAVKTGRERTWIDRWVVGDRFVIDLHWFWSLGIASPTAEYANLLTASPFAFPEASAFARAKLKHEVKAAEAGLSEAYQLLSTTFRPPAIRERWKTIEGRLMKLRRLLLDRSHRARYRLDRATISQLEHAARALLIARGSAALASDLIVHVGGTPTDAVRLRDTKKRLVRFGMTARAWGE